MGRGALGAPVAGPSGGPLLRRHTWVRLVVEAEGVEPLRLLEHSSSIAEMPALPPKAAAVASAECTGIARAGCPLVLFANFKPAQQAHQIPLFAEPFLLAAARGTPVLLGDHWVQEYQRSHSRIGF